MAKLYFKNTQHFQNPTRMIFAAGGELFGNSGETAKKIEAWIDNKESSDDAKKLAGSIAAQREEILSGNKKELLELYVDLFATSIDNKNVFNVALFTVDDTYTKNGLLEVLEKNSADLRIAFGNVEDLRLLSYATVYNNFKDQGLDANYLPKGASVVLVNGIVTVSYTENGVQKTASSEIFPWSTFEVARTKLNELNLQEAETAIPKGDVQAVREVAPGSAEPSVDVKVPVVPGETVTLETPKTPDKDVETNPNSLEKDWQRVLQKMNELVAADTRIAEHVEIREANRNENGADKTLIITNKKTGQTVRYMVGVNEKNNPSSYGPGEGLPIDPIRSHDASSINLTTWLIGNGNQTDELSADLDAYLNGTTMVPSVERGAYDLALLVSGFPPEKSSFPGKMPMNRSLLTNPSRYPNKKAAETLLAFEKLRPSNENDWLAAENAYQNLLSVSKPENISSKAHVLAASAAFVAGNIALAQARYRLAIAKNDDPGSVATANSQLESIQNAFANVYIEGRGLTVLSLQSSSDYHNKTIALAQAELTKYGNFSGLLPKGIYLLDNVPLNVPSITQ